MSRPTFQARAVNEQSRASLQADVMVTIGHLPTSISMLLTVEEARQLAFVILRETDNLQTRKDT